MLEGERVVAWVVWGGMVGVGRGGVERGGVEVEMGGVERGGES